MAAANAEQILRRSLETVAAEQKYDDPDIHLSAVSTEGANFTSFLFEATISSKDKDHLNLFAKVAAGGEKTRVQAPMRVFDIERIFYTELQKEYRQLEDMHEVPAQNRFKCPKMYTCSPKLYEETVVMENLTTQGYTLHDRFKSVDFNYAAASFTELAKLHALSMSLKQEKPEVYKRFIDEFKFEWTGTEEMMKSLIETAIKRTLELTRDENKGRLMAYLKNCMGMGMDQFMKFCLPGESPVIRHGDFRPSNLMHKVKDDGSLEVVPVDYQTLQSGTPVIDLLYFIFLGTDKQFRENHWEHLLDHYYEQLSAAMTRLRLDPQVTYSRKKFDADIKENLPYGLIISIMTLPLVTVESADAPSVGGEQDIDSFLNIKHGPVLKDRLNGIFDDFVRWGLL